MNDFRTKALSDAKPQFDQSKMAVHHWLSAPTIDTDGEIIDGTQFNLEKLHKGNPCFLWNHNRALKPLGSYSDPNGNYTLKAKAYPSGDFGLYGTVYFSQANPEAVTIFGLYCDKSLRCFSAGFGTGGTRAEKHKGRNVTRLLNATLAEGSAVNLPSNLDAVAIAVEKRMHNGTRIPERLAADLSHTLPKQKTFATTKIFSVLPSSVNADALESQSILTAGAKAMAEVTTVTETPAVDTDTLKLKAYAFVDELLADPANGEVHLDKLKAFAVESVTGFVTKSTDGVVIEPVADELSLRVTSLTENWNAAAPVLNDLQTKADKHAADFAAFREEYAGDMAIVQKLMSTLEKKNIVKLGAAA